MIDTLQKIAARLRPLRIAAAVMGAGCLVALGTIVLALPASHEANRYLMPAIIGFIWCLSAYGFIDTFQFAPAKTGRESGFVARFKRAAVRAWFWFLASLFFLSTLAALFLTLKLGSVWLGTYHG